MKNKDNIFSIPKENNKSDEDIYFTDEGRKLEIFRIERSICTIISKRGLGEGFFLKLPIGETTISTITTCEDIISIQSLKYETPFKLILHNGRKIKITPDKKKRKIYSFKEENITIIQLIEEDDISQIEFIYVDSYYFLKNENRFSIRENISFYENIERKIRIYKIGELLYKKNFYFSFSSSCPLSQGTPILLNKTLQLIGIYTSDKKGKNTKIGTYIGNIIEKIVGKKNYFYATYLVESTNLPTQLFGLDFKGLTVDNATMNVEGKELKFVKKFTFSSTGLQKIKISLKKDKLITTMKEMFKETSLFAYENEFLDTSIVTNMDYTFDRCFRLQSINLEGINTENVNSMKYTFSLCTNLIEINMTMLNTSMVTTIEGMLAGCSNLSSIDLSTFDTKLVTNMSSLFYGCTNIKEIILINNQANSFRTNNVSDMSFMFKNCSKLSKLDLSYFDTQNVIDMQSIFNGCSNLTYLNINSFTTNQCLNFMNMFYRCNSLIKIDISPTFNPLKDSNINFNMFHHTNKLRYNNLKDKLGYPSNFDNIIYY